MTSLKMISSKLLSLGLVMCLFTAMPHRAPVPVCMHASTGACSDLLGQQLPSTRASSNLLGQMPRCQNLLGQMPKHGQMP
jgi:hypothetical protein